MDRLKTIFSDDYLLNEDFVKNFNNAFIKNAEKKIDDNLIKTEKYAKKFNSIELDELISYVNVSSVSFNKSILIENFKTYLNSRFSHLNKNLLNDFYALYDNHQKIDLFEFTEDLKRYLDEKSITAASIEDYLLIKSIRFILTEKILLNKFFESTSVYRLLKTIYFEKIEIPNDIYKSIPLRYLYHMYIDLIFNIKKDTINNKNQIIINNLFNFLNNEKTILYRYFTILN